jgi:DNA processing protein
MPARRAEGRPPQARRQASSASPGTRILIGGGALISQFPDGTPPRRAHFPQRNWTMAALAELVVVVEAAEGSGALIAADAARRQGKRVMAVPGSVLSPLSVGCHRLLRDGAGLVESANDVLAELRAAGAALELPPLPGAPRPRPALPEGGR